MAQHVLDMVVRMQTGDVTTGLDGIENQLVNMADQIKNFKPPTFVDVDQVEAYESIQDALKTSSKLTGLVTANNYENYQTNIANLETAIEMANAQKLTGVALEEQAAASQRLERMTGRQLQFLEKSVDLIENNKKLVNDIIKGRVKGADLSKKQLKDIKKIAQNLEVIKDHGGDINKQHEDYLKKSKEISKFSDDATRQTQKWSDVLKKAGDNAEKIAPGLGQFISGLAPLKLFTDQMKMLNDVYEQNHTVNNLFLANAKDNVSITEGLSRVHLEATHSGVLLSESQKALNALLQAGVPEISANGVALSQLTTELALNARATGISESVLADLMTRTEAFGGSIGRTTKLADVFVNTMSKNRLTTAQMSKITNVLQKDLSRLDKAYKGVSKDGKIVASGSDIITSMMGDIGAAARDAGGSADAAMDLMTAAIERPLSVAALLQGSLTSSSIGDQFLTMGKNAEKFVTKMDKMPPALQAIFAQKLGTTPEQLRSLAKGTAGYNEEIKKVAASLKTGTDAEKLAIAKKEVSLRITKERSDAAAAEAIRTKAQENATRLLQLAFDQLRIVFGQLAMVVEPALRYLAELLTVMSNSKWKYVFIIAGGLLAIVGPLKIMSTVMGKMGSGIAKGIGGLGKGLVGLFKSLSQIKPADALKGALAIAAVGAALALGVYLIGKAAQELPPDKTANLLITIGGIVAASYLLIPLGALGPKALIGAVAVALVGAALALGIYLLGKAISTFPPNKTKQLGIMVAGLLAVSAIMILIGLGSALITAGAVALMLMSVMLAGSIAILSLVAPAMQNIATGLDILMGALAYLTPEMGEALIKVGAGLVIFAAAMTGAAVADMFGADMVGQAWKFAEAMTILQPAIASLASIGPTAAGAFQSIGLGLKAMSSALSGGGALDFFSGDTVKNARDLGLAMLLVAKPINAIGSMGEKTGNAFIKMAVGLEKFMKVLKEDAGWFDTFEENADDIGKALEKLSKPMSGMMGGQTEEIKSSLALSIEQGNNSSNEMLEKLEEIREAIIEGGGITGGDSESLNELRKTSGILERMLTEMSMGSSFGDSMADTRYNT